MMIEISINDSGKSFIR